MEKQLPKYHETFIPILEVLSDGKIIHYNELRKRVRDRFYADLSKEQLDQKTKAGDPLVLNRIGWGKAYLKQAEMIEQPERAMVKITDKGRSILKKGSLTIDELLSDKDFLANRKERKVEKDMQVIESDSSPQELIDAGIEVIESQVRSDLLAKLKTIDPYHFERVVNQLLERMGYGSARTTAKSGDGGIDGIIDQDQLGLDKIYIQAKRYTDAKVRETEIRNFIGAMSGDTNKGIFVTTSSFDERALQKAHDALQKIKLIDGDQLAELMYKHGVGVQVRDIYEIKQVDDDFFEEE